MPSTLGEEDTPGFEQKHFVRQLLTATQEKSLDRPIKTGKEAIPTIWKKKKKHIHTEH